MITIRQTSRLLFALCACVSFQACQSRQERFDALYDSVTTESEAEKYGLMFRPFLPEVVARLDKDTLYKIGTILGSWDTFECAVELEPFIAKECGAKRLYVAWITATCSHGNCPLAMLVLFEKSSDPLAEELRGEYKRILAKRGEAWIITDAQRCGYPIQDWRAMSSENRWIKIKQVFRKPARKDAS